MSLISRDFMTAEELAKVKGRSLKTVYEWIRQGIAPGHEPFAGRHWFKRDAVAKFKPPPRGRRPRKRP